MTMSKREYNKAKMRKLILDKSLNLFAYNGLDNTSISDIVTACKIGRGTFYNYYKTPKDVFEEIIDVLNKESMTAIKESQINSTSFYEFLNNSFKTYFDLLSTEELIMFHKNNQNYIRSICYSSPSIISIVSQLSEDFLKFEELDLDENKSKMLSFSLVSSAAELFICKHQGYFNSTNEKMASFLAKLYSQGVGMPVEVSTLNMVNNDK